MANTVENSAEMRAKERHFCEQYILDYNGTQAAIRAGYPEKSAAKKASGLLHRPEILAAIRELQKERSKRLCVDADFVMAETLDLLKKCKAATPVTAWDYTRHEMVETGEYQLDSKGACKCLELLGKMVGIGTEKPAEYALPVFVEDIPAEDGPPGDGNE